MSIKVLLYEDNTALRDSIATLMQWNEGFVMIAAMPDAESILQDVDQFVPDVIIMDIDMPHLNGIEALKLLRKKNATLPVIMLTVFEDNENITDSICVGANGYLLKKNMDQLLPSITDVLNGGAPMTSTVARRVLQLFPRTFKKSDLFEMLTARESEIMNWLVKGYSYKMIASELSLNVETVRSHIKNIYKKLQVNSATEAVYKATGH